jgi:hypothetical protein
MIYFFNYIISDVIIYLKPCFKKSAAKRFKLTKEIFEYLNNIYLNPFK